MSQQSPLSRLEDRYLEALRHHILNTTEKARNRSLGDEAMAMGLETLDLARIHEQALAKLLPGAGSAIDLEKMTSQAGRFFTEAVLPLEETHRIALEARAQLLEIIETLRTRTEELARSKRELRKQTSNRAASEVALENSRTGFDSLLGESRILESQLKAVAHQFLAEDEEQKHLVSDKLRDEIAQALLGLHIRLLALKQGVSVNQDSLAQEIAATQELVEHSVQTIQRFVLELGPRHES